MPIQPRLSATPAVEAVLRGAMAKKSVGEFTEAAVQKCFVKGWVQFEGDAGETLALTGTGRKACEALGYTT